MRDLIFTDGSDDQVRGRGAMTSSTWNSAMISAAAAMATT